MLPCISMLRIVGTTHPEQVVAVQAQLLVCGDQEA
jgi:hypothetical protein